MLHLEGGDRRFQEYPPPAKIFYRAEKINQFLWQVAYRIPATKDFMITNHWIPNMSSNRIIRRNDPRSWCIRCPLNEYEDLLHLLWKCPESRIIWEWVFALMWKVSKFRDSDWSFTVA
jgi:hypothetical protein